MELRELCGMFGQGGPVDAGDPYADEADACSAVNEGVETMRKLYLLIVPRSRRRCCSPAARPGARRGASSPAQRYNVTIVNRRPAIIDTRRRPGRVPESAT